MLLLLSSNQQQHSGALPGLQRACLMAIGRLSKASTSWKSWEARFGLVHKKDMFGLLLVRVPKSNPKPPTTQTNNQSPVECWVVAREDFLHNTLMLEAASFCRMWHPYGLSVWVSSQRLPNQQLEGIMAKESG